MKKIIAIINQKGGVGKTTTSINFASGLARKGFKTLLIDLDPQAHSTIGVGLLSMNEDSPEQPKSFDATIDDVLTKKTTLKDAIMATDTKNLFAVASEIKLEMTEQQYINSEVFRESLLKKALDTVEDEFDYAVIDCRPTLGNLTINALYAANFIIIPSEMGRYSLEGFSDLMGSISKVKNGKVNKTDLVRILLTKFDSRKRIVNEWVTGQLEPYRDILFSTTIRMNEALNQSQIVQQTIFDFKPDSPGAQDYENLTNEFLSI